MSLLGFLGWNHAMSVCIQSKETYMYKFPVHENLVSIFKNPTDFLG